MSDLIFTLSAGRSGSAWLAKFLEANLGFPVLHEPLGIDDFGTRMPDIRVMRAFNSRGMDPVVSEFWQRKFAHIPTDQPYGETNHTLGKCGLIEALAESPLRERAKVVVLRRNLAKQCISYIQRSDFVNITIPWQWYLTPQYPNVIVNPDPFVAMGVTGQALWYTMEMECRQIYYEKRFADLIHFIPAQLEEVTQPEGAQHFLNEFGLETTPVLPKKTNAGNYGDTSALVAEIETFLNNVGFDPVDLTDRFLNAGRSLDLQRQKMVA